ncbi:unnamed protein product [Lymnaea stagnalis]|uniref:VWFA domain-containing protein n=1 Tax=Lymnaea stagnalis TaxID=6523 RepID=A0AAV2HA74_LYMST
MSCTAVVDLIYVLDSSGSIGPNNYKKQINFTIDLASNFKIGPSNVLVGAVIFSHLAQKYFDLKDNPSLAELRRVLSATPYMNYTTKTDQALDLVASAGMFNANAGGRSNSKKIVIVITDGLSDNPTLTKEAATRLKSQGVTILAVGIGAAQDAELQNIASGSQNVFKATNFDALKQIVASVTQRACPGTSG